MSEKVDYLNENINKNESKTKSQIQKEKALSLLELADKDNLEQSALSDQDNENLESFGKIV